MDDPRTHYTAFDVGERWRIVPPGALASPGPRLCLTLARGAFGSGEHDTTASCLELLAGLALPPGARALDFGCGTGVLSVAALRLGAAHALGVDISAAAVACARRNLELNGLADRAELRQGGLEVVGDEAFDLVLANIYGDIILDVGATLVQRARPGGLLLLSGILWGDSFEVRTLLEAQGCRLLAQRLLEEHCTLLAARA